MTNAPIVIKDLVIAGISGGEFGVRGRVTAYDVNSGKKCGAVFDGSGRRREDRRRCQPELRVAPRQGPRRQHWQGDEWTRAADHVGWYSYDPQLNLFYYSSATRAAGTRSASRRQQVVDDDLRRNPDNGEVKWAYQMTPHDEWTMMASTRTSW